MAFYIFLILTIIWFVFMTWLSHQDGEHTDRTSKELAKRLKFLYSDSVILNNVLRKLAHVVVFAVFTFLWGLTIKAGGLSPWLMMLAVIWAWADEATKPMIPGRHFSWFDVRLNLVGVVLAGVVWVLV